MEMEDTKKRNKFVTDLIKMANESECRGNYFRAVEHLEKAKIYIDSVEKSNKKSDVFEELCNKICKILNFVAMIFLKKGNMTPVLELLKRATENCQYSTELAILTHNNFACYYRATGKYRSALGHLEKALSKEKNLRNYKNIADIFLNICVVLSNLKKHKDALDAALNAIFLIQEELLEYSMPPLFKQERKREIGDVREIVLERIKILIVAYHNMGAELEHLNLKEDAYKVYEKGANMASNYLGPESELAKDLYKIISLLRPKSVNINLRGEKTKLDKKENDSGHDQKREDDQSLEVSKIKKVSKMSRIGKSFKVMAGDQLQNDSRKSRKVEKPKSKTEIVSGNSEELDTHFNLLLNDNVQLLANPDSTLLTNKVSRESLSNQASPSSNRVSNSKLTDKEKSTDFNQSNDALRVPVSRGTIKSFNDFNSNDKIKMKRTSTLVISKEDLSLDSRNDKSGILKSKTQQAEMKGKEIWSVPPVNQPNNKRYTRNDQSEANELKKSKVRFSEITPNLSSPINSSDDESLLTEETTNKEKKKEEVEDDEEKVEQEEDNEEDTSENEKNKIEEEEEEESNDDENTDENSSKSDFDESNPDESSEENNSERDSDNFNKQVNQDWNKEISVDEY